MVITLNPTKEITNPAEKMFAEIMDAKGLTVLYHPTIRDRSLRYNGHWQPDFFCLDDGCYYEVINHGSMYDSNAAMKLIDAGWPVRFVNPKGEPFVKKGNSNRSFWPWRKGKCDTRRKSKRLTLT